jgi:hypothetical protein
MSINYTSLSPNIKDSKCHTHQEKPAVIAVTGTNLHRLQIKKMYCVDLDQGAR